MRKKTVCKKIIKINTLSGALIYAVTDTEVLSGRIDTLLLAALLVLALFNLSHIDFFCCTISVLFFNGPQLLSILFPCYLPVLGLSRSGNGAAAMLNFQEVGTRKFYLQQLQNVECKKFYEGGNVCSQRDNYYTVPSQLLLTS